jgi:hypothetical protein
VGAANKWGARGRRVVLLLLLLLLLLLCEFQQGS